MTTSSTLQSVFTLPFQNIRNYVSVTLKNDGSNYLIWKNQFKSILLATDLYQFVDGTTNQPKEFIISEENTILNPVFVVWKKLDRFVMSCLNATLEYDVSCFVFGVSSSREIWSCLEKDFVQKIKAKRFSLHKRLYSLMKGTSCISIYFSEIKEITDLLAAIDEHVKELDIVLCALHGLGKEYRQLVVSLHNRIEELTLEECKYHLLLHEQWLKIEDLESSQQIAENVGLISATRYHSSSPLCASLEVMKSSSKTDFSHICCQICKKFGHTANRCLFRYEPSKSSEFSKKNVQSRVSTELKQHLSKRNIIHVIPRSNVASGVVAVSSGGGNEEIADTTKTACVKNRLHQASATIQEDSVDMCSISGISDESVPFSAFESRLNHVSLKHKTSNSSGSDNCVAGCSSQTTSVSSQIQFTSDAAYIISAIITSSCMVHTLVAGANDLLWLAKVLRKVKANSGHDSVVNNKLTSEGAPTPSVPPDLSISATMVAPDVASPLVVTKSNAHYASQLSSQGLQG